MNTFTFSKTDQWLSPTLSPATLIIEPERFDIELGRKLGEKVNGFFTKKGEYVHAYKPKADSGYNAETEVIVAIGKLEDSVIVGNRVTEHYVFNVADWQRVYEIGKKAEPLERPRSKDTSGPFGD